MDHVAIMRKSWGLIPKILSGEKAIESRWYRTKRTPWDKVTTGDYIYFKNAGEPVTARATAAEILQFNINSITDIKNIVSKYGKEICLVNSEPTTWGGLPKYCILIKLATPMIVTSPFDIDKSGFGIGAAWLTVPNINKIKIV